MPNWCYQHMTIAGNTKNLKAFRKAIHITEVAEAKVGNDDLQIANAETSDLPLDTNFVTDKVSEYDSLNHLFPTPQELRDTVAGSMQEGSDEALALAKQEVSNMEKYGHKNWYDWNNENWGTKWGACDLQVNDEINNQRLTMYYESAWSPASGLIKNISGQFPELIFAISYTEESCAFAGWQIFSNGYLIKEGNVPTELSRKLDRMHDEIGLLPDDDTTKNEKYQEFYELADEYRSRMTEVGDEDLEENITELVKKSKNVGK